MKCLFFIEVKDPFDKLVQSLFILSRHVFQNTVEPESSENADCLTFQTSANHLAENNYSIL